MENLYKTTAVSSNNELENLATGDLNFTAEYAFNNPESINGPFGVMTLNISFNEATGKEIAWGDIKINTLWGLGSVTNIHFGGPSAFDGSTGYTTINANGAGTITVFPNPPRYIKAKVGISLKPGLKDGTLSVEGFFEDFQIRATQVNYSKE